MIQKRNVVTKLILSALGLLVFASIGSAQVWTYRNNDLILGLRKNTPYTENYEVVVDIGQASNYLGLAIGTKVAVSGFTATQLTPGSFTSLNNLSWSVFSPATYSGYPARSLWLTVPRTNNSVQSATPYGFSSTGQQLVTTKMVSIPGAGGAGYVSLNLGASNQFNTPTFVRETIATYSGHTLSTWLEGATDPTTATFNDTWPSDEPNNGNVENTTPSSFSGTVRSDLYEVRSNNTNGPANYVGYFEFKSDGTMTFTRDQASTAPPLPPPPVLSTTHTGLVSTISFVSSNSATYTLLFTNSAGLGAPSSSWPAKAGTITGNGSTQSFQDTSSDANRFYRVQAH